MAWEIKCFSRDIYFKKLSMSRKHPEPMKCMYMEKFNCSSTI